MPADSSRAVFLSYASQDAQAARRICEALRAAGVEVWFDQSELRGGDKWDQNIRRQIRECALFAPIISANTQARGEGYFRLEWKLAADRSHLMARDQMFFLPVVIDDTSYATARVPEEFHSVQWTRLTGGETSDAFCDRVRTLLTGDFATRDPLGMTVPAWDSRPPPKRGTVPPLPDAGRWRAPLGLAVAAGVVALAALLWWKMRPGSPAGAPADRGNSQPVAAAQPAAAGNPEVRQLVAKARELFQDSDDAKRANFFEAEELLKRAAALDAGDADARAAYSQLSTDLYRYAYDRTPARLKLMRELTNEALRLAPDGVEARLAEASAADYFKADPVQTEEKLRVLTERAPQNFRVWQAYGRRLGRAGKVDAAAAALARGDEAGRTNPAPMADAALYFLAAGRYAEAEAAVAKSIARRLNGRALIWDVVLKLCWHGNAAAAAAALEQWPPWLFTEDRGATVAGLVWLWNHEPEKALAIYERVSREFLRDINFTGPRAALTAMAHAQAGHAERAKADWELALRAADRELALDPESFYALHWKARALAERGDRASAEQILQSFLRDRIEPASFYAPEGKLAALALAVGQPELAVAFLQHSLEVPPGTVPLFKNAFVNFPLSQAILKLNPVFAPLRNDERFKQIVARAPAPGAPTPPPPPGLVDLKSIAVLAFDNRSDDKSDDSFSDGMSEELLNMLAKVPGLTVKARNSSFYFKGRNATPQEIGRQLGVSHFVSGSVERMGNAVRIMAQLSRTDTGDMDWSERFMGDLSKPWELQERIAGSIAEKLKLKLGATMQARQTVNPEAYRLVLEGRHFWNLRTTDGFARAEADCIAALQLDPNFAPAHALLANVCVIRAAYRAYEGMGEPTAEDVARARVEAQKAIALDPTAADPVLAMAYALQLEGRLAEAEAEFRHAITLSPNYALAHHWLGSLLEVRGRLRECVAELERAAQLDPLSFILLNTLTRNLRHAQRYEEALAVSERSLALRSDFKPALTYHAQILLALGRREQAVEYARRFFTAPDSGPAWSCYAETILVLQQAGLAQEAAAFGEKSLGRWPDGSYQRGLVLAVLGRWDEAWPRMERTPLACCHGLLWLSVWDNMRDTPRFRQMLATIGCEAEYKTAREELARLINDRKARK